MTVYEQLAASAIVCGAGVYLFKEIRARRRKTRARCWPTAVAKVYRNELHETRLAEANTVYRLDLRYSYEPSDDLLGELFFGRYIEDFNSCEEAQIAQTCLTSRPLYVRYNPGAPAEYHMDPYRDF